MRTRLAVVALSCSALTACGGLKDALTDHVNTVARAGSSRLSVTDLAQLMGQAKVGVAVNKQNAEILANIWANFHRMAYASAHGDSLIDMIDVAMAPTFNSERVTLYQDSLRKTAHVDSATQAGYDAGAGGVFAARHILFKFPDSTGIPCQPYPCPSPRQKDSVRQAAQIVLAQVTNANFAEMAKAHPGDPSSAAQGGALPLFTKDQMIPEFSKATAELKPGEISHLVESSYGEHIIQRRTFADVRQDYSTMFNQNALRTADRALRDDVSTTSNIVVNKDAGSVAKAVAAASAEHRKDPAILATFTGGALTVGQFLSWLQSRPPEERIVTQIAQAPDSTVGKYVKEVAIQEILLRRATAAKIDVPATERQAVHDQFRELYDQVQRQLGLSAQLLADSAKTAGERESLASRRVDAFIGRFLAGEIQPTDLPSPIKTVLDAKYDVTISGAALDRVVQEAAKVRASADSARGAAGPPGNGRSPD